MGANKSSKSQRTATPTSRKRSRDDMQCGELRDPNPKQPLSDDFQDEAQSTPRKSKKVKKISSPEDNEEKRLKKFRIKAPLTWLERLDRAVSQRMFLVDRQRTGLNGHVQETFSIAGSTGNVYSVIIKHIPSCTCQDAAKGNICKHIIYVLRRILKAPEDIIYQAAFLTSELKRIFDGSPVPQVEAGSKTGAETHRKRIDGDCPICFMSFKPASEEIIWCKAVCGNNIHRECFEKWAQVNGGSEVRCVYCRSEWEKDDPSMEDIRSKLGTKTVNREGYVNIASELGISTHRDTSSYHSYWVNQRFRRGADFETK